MKYLSFCNYPRILVILLKRFKYNRDFNKIEKINNFIEFPINLVFDINNNSVSEINNHNDYKLISIILHSGFPQYGYYFAVINEQKTNKWYIFNDTEITNYDIN